MLLRDITEVVGIGPWAFVVTVKGVSTLVRCLSEAQASFYAFAIRNHPDLKAEVSPIFPPQVVRYYDPTPQEV